MKFRKIRSALQRQLNILRFRLGQQETTAPKFPKKRLRREGYYSQYGQDKWVYENLTRGKRSGVFVDIGAYDGVTLSNTYFLEKVGWQGIAIEPNPTAYEQLLKSRTCATINGCISAKEGTQRFRQISEGASMLSGLIEDYDPQHLARIESEIHSKGASQTEIEVHCYTLNQILRSHKIRHVDYLTIDVEGAEFKILESIDFEAVTISMIGVENNYGDDRIEQLLRSKGFRLHSKINVDEFYTSN